MYISRNSLTFLCVPVLLDYYLTQNKKQGEKPVLTALGYRSVIDVWGSAACEVGHLEGITTHIRTSLEKNDVFVEIPCDK